MNPDEKKDVQTEDFFEHQEELAEKGRKMITILGLISLPVSLIVFFIILKYNATIPNIYFDLIIPISLLLCRYKRYTDSDDNSFPWYYPYGFGYLIWRVAAANVRLALIIIFIIVILMNLYILIDIAVDRYNSGSNTVTDSSVYDKYISGKSSEEINIDAISAIYALAIFIGIHVVIAEIFVKSETIKSYFSLYVE